MGCYMFLPREIACATRYKRWNTKKRCARRRERFPRGARGGAVPAGLRRRAAALA